ncbi:hypothetical protein [Algoriphagus formosus]|uniref:hypothetical protein n=1 Tax=Algoriphagus formosus TaxID=2007308 RepID=UPI003F6E470E
MNRANRRSEKKSVKQLQKNIVQAGKKVERIERVVLGFNFLVDKKAVEIDLPSLSLYRELIGTEPKEMESWMKNAYLYCRMKKGMAPGAVLFFKDIESGVVIGQYDGKRAIF